MSSFKNAAKSFQKQHRERSQPAARQKYGLLEKKKDYKLRAEDHQKKQSTIKALKRKALDRNPDEFYFKMVRTGLKDGEHQSEDPTPKYTDDQIKLMETQDLKYVNYKRSVELKKIERLKASLHMLDAKDKPKNKHIVFVDTKKEVEEFDAAKHLDTHPSLLGRTFNRPRMEQLQKMKVDDLDNRTLAENAVERKKRYQELANRIDREKKLRILAQKMEIKKQVRKDKKGRKKLMKEETPESAAQYKWVFERKR